MDINRQALTKFHNKWFWYNVNSTNRLSWFQFFITAFGLSLTSFSLSLLFADGSANIPLTAYFVIVFLAAGYGNQHTAIFAVLLSVICGFVFYVFPFYGFIFQYNCILQLGALLLGTTIIAYFTVVTRKAYLQQKQEKERFQTIIEKSHEGLITTNRHGEINYTCPSTLTLLGYTEEEFIGMSFFMLIHADGLSAFRRQFNKLTNNNGDESIKARYLLKTKNGDWMWVESRIKNLLGDDHVKGVVFQFIDVSQLVNEEHQQEDYVNIASHELKSPITALYGYMQLLKLRSDDSNGELNKVIKRMDIQLFKMQDIISAMLDNTKIKAGEVQYVTQNFDLNECIKDTVDAIKISTVSHTISWHFESPARVINGDQEKISRVLTNLISNAVKYSPQGKTVEITTLIEKDAIKVIITDHGIGIAKEKQSHLFQRFYRVDTLSKNLAGLGLGLYIASEIIQYHQGQIGVNSVEGAGSSFWFTLPIIADQI